MRALENPIRPYAWGSRIAIAAMHGRPVPSPGPEAELWLGAHASAPSTVAGQALGAVIAGDPQAILGPRVCARFGPRLPYLLKILAAAEPLSLQVHPDAEQAAAGFAAESGRAPGEERNYADPFHKPELLVALAEFDALCGFRDPQTSAQALAAMGVPALRPLVQALGTGTTQARLRASVEMILGWPRAARPELVAKVAASGEPLAADLAQRYPHDVGVVLALLLNRVTLRPDEAVFMPAGNLHGYLRGVGVEVMAASDNVARAGLTLKRVDPAEVLRQLRYEVLADPVVRPDAVGPGVLTWAAPVADFRLHKAEPAGVTATLPGGGPRIVVCVAGEGVLRARGQALAVRGGSAMFVEAGEPAVEVDGDDTVVFQASC